jgi:hypothetical protein
MPSPVPSKIPSEATVEQLSNHHLLMAISPFDGWFYVPTRPEEKLCGFDASLQNSKCLVIQYKRLTATSKSKYAIKINPPQLNTLKSTYPKACSPYVLYAFSTLPSYAALSSLFASGAGSCFGANMCFVDAHDIAPGTLKLVAAGPAGPVFAVLATGSTPVASRSLSAVANDFLSCRVGLPTAAFASTLDQAGRTVLQRGRFSHVHTLQARHRRGTD